MSRKHKVYKGRMPEVCKRFQNRVTLNGKKLADGIFHTTVTQNGWSHGELIRHPATAVAVATALGVKSGEKKEFREHTYATTPDAPTTVFELGESRLMNECHAPRADKSAPHDTELKAGDFTLTVRLRQTEGRPNMRPDELLRASSKAREELDALARQFGFTTRELGRKQSAVDSKWHGGSCDFAITGTLTREAYEAIQTARYTVSLSVPWVTIGSGTNERMPKDEATRRRDMQRKHERQADLRKQFNVK